MKTEEIVRSLRWCGTGTEENCGGCSFEPQCDEDAVGCVGGLCDAAADKIEELVDRCARYAEEIAVLRERAKRVAVTERRPKRDGRYLCWYTFGKERDSVLYQSMVFCQVLDYYATDPRPHFQHEGTHGMAVTHWMDIPEVTQDE